jgi:hypothetical protein
VNPNTAATNAITKKITAQRNIFSPPSKMNRTTQLLRVQRIGRLRATPKRGVGGLGLCPITKSGFGPIVGGLSCVYGKTFLRGFVLRKGFLQIKPERAKWLTKILEV